MVSEGEILSGRYLLKDEIGAGGMGTVYRAVDLRTGAQVAVKVPHAFLARDSGYVERLRREAQIAASVQSPRVALVTDFAEHEGTLYLVMEYVPGETVSSRIQRDGPVPVEDALHIALEVARALDAAHQRGITHRDLKPQNIVISDGDVKVLDFGIARLEGQSSLTSAGTLIGSPEYLAPERAEGPGDIRSDIYALGIVIYEMLTGRVPFDGGTPWTIVQRQLNDPPPPLPPYFAAAVYPIVERCLAKRPDERYQTPRELATALQAAIRGNTASLAPAPAASTPAAVPRSATSEVERTVIMPARRSEPITPPPSAGRAESVTPPPPPSRAQTPIPATLAASLPLAASPKATPESAPPAPVAAAVAPPWSATPPTASRPSRRRIPIWIPLVGTAAVVAVIVGAVLFSRGGGDSDARSAGGSGATNGGTITGGGGGGATSGPGAPPALTVIAPTENAQVDPPVAVEVKVDGATLKAPTEGDPGARHLHYFIDTDPNAVLSPGQAIPTGVSNIIHSPQTIQNLELSPGSHTVWVILTDNNHVPLSPPVESKTTFTVSGTPARTGEQAPVVYQSLIDQKWRLLIVEGTGRNARRLPSGNWDDIEPVWSPDGARIAFASNRGGNFQLYVMNTDGSGVQQLSTGAGQAHSPSWSPDGTVIAFHSDRAGERNQVFTVAARGGEARQLTRLAAGAMEPTWAPDSKRLAFRSQDQDGSTHVYTVDAAGGEPKQVTTPRQRHINPAWSPSGRQIAFSAFAGGRWNIYVMNPDGSDVRQVTNDEVNWQPSWSPNSRELVFASGRDGQQQIFALPLEGGQPRRLTEGLAHNWRPAWPRK